MAVRLDERAVLGPAHLEVEFDEGVAALNVVRERAVTAGEHAEERAGDGFHQRGLTLAVGAHEGDQTSGQRGEVDGDGFGEAGDPPEGQVVQFQLRPPFGTSCGRRSWCGPAGGRRR
ncbi:hypothetical protein D3C72_1947640 [compost metagenome]